MQGPMRQLLCAAAAGLLAGGVALAQPASAPSAGTQPAPSTGTQAAASAEAPTGFVAPALPEAEDTNAERARSQPLNNAPFWRDVRESGERPGTTSLPGREMGVLVQDFTQYPGSRYTTAGEAWREVRNNLVVPYGGSLLLIALVALALFYFARGPMGEAMPREGRRIERFTPFERAAHWTNAIAFVILAISGLVLAFGRELLLPWMGGAVFGWLAYALKTVHNFVGPLFVVSLVVVILTFVRDELPRRGDGEWLRRPGKVLRDQEPPSHRFNAGEKVVFWLGVVLLGLVVAGSGLVLDMVFPNLAYTRGQMQVAHMIHSVAAMLMMAVLFLHIYLGTIGMRGAYDAMRHGWVDDHWAQEHHGYWAEDIRTGKIPAQRSGKRAERLKGRTA